MLLGTFRTIRQWETRRKCESAAQPAASPLGRFAPTIVRTRRFELRDQGFLILFEAMQQPFGTRCALFCNYFFW